ITIQGSSNLSKDEVERMKKEAESHATEDKKRREVVDLRNQADQIIAVSEKTLKDAGDKAKPEDKTAVEEKVKALKDVKDKDDTEAIQKAMSELSDAIQKVGAAMYADQQSQPASAEGAADSAQGAPAADATTGADANPTVDAEFEEKK
ncbi:MAG: Hsp70 family protein, partial [Candidatus Doudnabacteria bacterium]|nr:Hsp70 family protein [Candidatus Doudnabacteria bacterium]